MCTSRQSADLPTIMDKFKRREYCPIYRGPGFLVRFGSAPTPPPPPPPPVPVSKLSRRHIGRLRKRGNGRGGKEDGRGFEAYDRKKAWPSINHQMLSG